MKKKILAITLLVVILVTAVTGATLAYFTDTDEATNVFTVGDVEISIREEDGNGNPYDVNQEFVPGERVDKKVFIDNVGENDAYIRAYILWPSMYNGAVGAQFWGYWENEWSFADGSKDEREAMSKIVTVDVDGVEYMGFVLYCDKPVEPGKPAGGWSLLSNVTLSSSFDWVDKENMVFTLGNGEYKRTITGDPDVPINILVRADAIQAEGFTDVFTAFAAFDTQNG